MDIRVTGSDPDNRGRDNSTKTESVYREVPEIAEERKVNEHEDQNGRKRKRAVTFGMLDAEKVEEAVMNDDIAKFRSLNMTLFQILEFNYEISGPKSSA